MKLLLFNKKFSGYMLNCERYNINPMVCIITNGNIKTFLPFEYIHSIPLEDDIHLYFIYENKIRLEIKLNDIMNCEYVEFGLFFNIYLK